MDNKVLFGVMCILFNHLGVPCFMQGNAKTGVLRIVFSFITLGILGIKVLKMSDEEYAAQKGKITSGIPAMK